MPFSGEPITSEVKGSLQRQRPHFDDTGCDRGQWLRARAGDMGVVWGRKNTGDYLDVHPS